MASDLYHRLGLDHGLLGEPGPEAAAQYYDLHVSSRPCFMRSAAKRLIGPKRAEVPGRLLPALRRFDGRGAFGAVVSQLLYCRS